MTIPRVEVAGNRVLLHIGDSALPLTTSMEARALRDTLTQALVYLDEVERRDADLRDREVARELNALRFAENVTYGSLPQPFPRVTTAPAPALPTDGAA